MLTQNQADYLIIGGGISGVSIGYNLLKNGAKNVVLLERHYLASGATGRCGAGIRQQWSTELNCKMSKYSCDFFENAVDELEYDGDIEFHQGGYLMLISTEKELQLMKEINAFQNSMGIMSRMLTLEEAKEVAPPINTDGLYGASYYEKDGHLNPFHTTQAYADAFKRLGGTIYTNTEVSRVLTEHGKAVGVETNQGTIMGGTVILCAGGYSQDIAKTAGVSLPLYSERHQILVTEPLDPILDPMLMSFSLNFYCQQVPHGSFVMGRSGENEAKDLRITASHDFLDEMCTSITKIVPALKNVRLLRQWAGLYNMTQDKQSIYGSVPELENFYVAVGFSGHGFMMAPATGRIMAEIVLGLEPTLPWDRLNINRFKQGNLILEKSVV